MLRVLFLQLDGTERPIDVPSGTTILEAAKANDLPIVGTCGGSMVCATCHVMIDGPDRAKLPPPSEDEEDALDLAFGVTADSRLGCQIHLADELDGIRIRLTSTMHTA
jgi:ferredoxin